jgi:glycosyltransferase involved in cell wall biosynthesis
MRVAVLHNFYCQRGGEDAVFAAETALLERFGHSVHRFSVQNRDIDGSSLGSLVACAAKSVYSPASGRELRRFLRQVGADLVHVHNFFPRLSPAVYWAARAEGLPVVQTLHNYRLLCAGATLYRDGRICEKCLGRSVPLAGVRHGCFRGSRAGSAAVAAMVGLHGLLRTWSDKVDVYIAPTEFARRKFIEGGLPAEKIAVKPHFVPTDPGPGDGRGGYVLFAGRLAEDKGIATMLAAWAQLRGRFRLKIAGDGPQASLVREAAASVPGVEWLGEKRHDGILELMGDAALLLVPSEWYETFGLVVIEAYAKGTPVLASNLGAIAELVRPRRTGWLFRPGDAEDLAQTIMRALSSTEDLRRMRRQARMEFEERFQPEQNYRQLLRIYETARARAERLPSNRSAGVQ